MHLSPTGSFASTTPRRLSDQLSDMTSSAAANGEAPDPFDALDVPEFSGLALLPYLAGLAYPAYILPSPRLSSSSEPSLKAIWTNDPAAELSDGLEAIVSYTDSRRLKSLIASQDQLDEEHWAAEQTETGETASITSFSSFDKALENSFDVEVSIPRWSKRRPYRATLQPSAHPSFFVLLLVPRAPVRYKPRPWVELKSTYADSVDSTEHPIAGSLVEAPESQGQLSVDNPVISKEAMRLEWTSLRDQGPARVPIDTENYVWSATEAQANTDWSKTPIGPPKQWPLLLSTLMNTIEGMPGTFLYLHMGAIWWYLGDEVDDWFIVHNSVYEEKLRNPGRPHYGRLASDAWGGEHWPTLKGRAHTCMNTGKGIFTDEDSFYVRDVETYWSWRWSPIIGPKGEKFGILVTSFVATPGVLAERYLDTSRTLASNLLPSRTTSELTEGLLKALELNERDFPYAMLYHLRTETSTGQRCDLSAEGTIVLAGSVGLPFDHPLSPRQVVLDLSSPPSAVVAEADWPLKAALQQSFHSDEPIYLSAFVVELPEELRLRSWGDVPTSASVYKISNLDEPSGHVSFLILGMNPRRPFDKQYSDWLNDIQRAVLLTMRNISFIEEERKQQAALASLDKAKSAFMSNVTHELRTPLTLITGPLTDLEGAETSPTRKASFAMIQRNASRLSRLVSSILDFSKMEAGQVFGRFSPTNLGQLTLEIAEAFRPSIEKAKIKFTVECTGNSNELVYIDQGMVEKILYNLLGNALKYTLRGSISVQVAYHPDEVVLSVTDTGVGVQKVELSHITERFYRVQSHARSFEGTGLGLALVAELVQVLGGRLEIESSTAAESPTGESGSTFQVFLLYGHGHLPEGAIDHVESREFTCSAYSRGLIAEADRWTPSSNGSGSIRTNGSSSVSQGTPSDSGVSVDSSSKIDVNTLFWDKSDTILLVDDSADMLQYLYGVLSQHCKVVMATDGDKALQTLRKQPVNLVISDIQMPTMDGYGLLAGIRALEDPDRAVTPIILISARAGEEERVAGILAGADDFLPKPFSAKELIARAHLQVQLGKKRLELERNFRNESATTKLLSDLSPVGLTRWDESGAPLYANAAWYRQSGHPRNRSLADWMDSIDPAYKIAMAQMSADLFQGRKQVEGEWRWCNGNWSHCSAVIIEGHEAESYNGTICVLTDITERKRYEAERKLAVEAEEAHLRQRAEIAEERKREADDQKRQQEFLVALVSHEIRNPTSAILQITGLCRSNISFFRTELAASLASGKAFEPTSELVNLLDEDIEALDHLQETAHLIERIANDFLSLGKIQLLGKLEVFPLAVDLAAEVRRLLGSFQSEARIKGIHMSLDLKGQLSEPAGQHFFLIDPVRLGQVVVNLVNNAIRFTSASTRREVTITLEVSPLPPSDDTCKPPTDSTASFTPGGPAYIYGAVTDSGPGLAPEQLQLLFQRFQQASSSTHTVFGGSGVGLYVCRLITGLMDGRIEVDSVKGEGSTFRFFVKAQVPDDQGNVHSIPEVKPVLVEFPHVLVVEDNLINARVLERQLKKAGMTCKLAFDGQQGVDAVVKSFEEGEKRFNVILMDQEMPIMDGRTAAKHIRRLEAEGALPVRTVIFALTGNAQESQIAEALACGMDAVLLKPYRIEQLLAKLRTSSQVV